MSLKFRIYGHWPDGSEDSIIVEGDTVEEIRARVDEEIKKRSWTGCWSVEVTE